MRIRIKASMRMPKRKKKRKERLGKRADRMLLRPLDNIGKDQIAGDARKEFYKLIAILEENSKDLGREYD